MNSSILSTALEKARLIEIRARRAIDEQLSGPRRSVFRGRGMDFEEVREYVPGDDVRAIDWRVTARAGKPFIKKYREERELTVLLVVDVSASGSFGSTLQSKRELAAEVASVLALSSMRQRDKVGLLSFSEDVEHFIAPASGRGHTLRLIDAVLTTSPRARGTDIGNALDYVGRVLRRRGAVVLLSDFQVPRETHSKVTDALRRVSRRHEVAALWMRDPRELELPNVGILTLEDAETGDFVVLDTSRAQVREAFAAEARAHARAVEAMVRTSGAELLELSTAVDYLPTLNRFLSGRAPNGRAP